MFRTTTAPFAKLAEHLHLKRIKAEDLKQIDSISVLHAYLAQDTVVQVATDKWSTFSRQFNDEIFLNFVTR